MAFEHEMAYITAKIDVIAPEPPNPVGTGFFYHVSPNDGTDCDLLFLISNKHVFKDPRGKLTISLNRRKTGYMPDFGNIRTFIHNGFEHIYYAHPNPEVDLACVDVSDIPPTDAFTKFLNRSLLREIDYAKVALGSDVIFVGYPRGYYDVVNNLPLIRRGSIASMPSVDFNGKGQVVIDAHLFHGSSGSPVFVSWDNRYSLLGVVSGGVKYYSEIEPIPINMPPVAVEQAAGVEQMAGLGIVEKQRHVQELIDYTVEEYIRRKSSSS